jgi:hypothetical protein
LGLTDRVLVTEGEFQPISLVQIKRILVKDLDVHLPFLQIVTLDDCNSRWDMLLHLEGQRSEKHVHRMNNMHGMACSQNMRGNKGDKPERKWRNWYLNELLAQTLCSEHCCDVVREKI